MSVKDLGADYLVCACYKWLLSCYGTGFFWIKNEHLDTLRPRPFYWTGQNTDNFSELNFVDFKPSRTPNAGTPQNGQRTTTSISPRWRSRWISCCVPARNMSPRTIAVLSNLCIVISQRIVVLPQVRWSPEDAGRLGASQRANRAVESTEPSQQSSLSAFSGQLRPLVSFRKPHVTFPADKNSSLHILRAARVA